MADSMPKRGTICDQSIVSIDLKSAVTWLHQFILESWVQTSTKAQNNPGLAWDVAIISLQRGCLSCHRVSQWQSVSLLHVTISSTTQWVKKAQLLFYR